MHINKLEEWIKNAFDRHLPETDNEAIWEQIEPRLKKKKKRRFIIFFFALGLGMLLLFLMSKGWERLFPSTTAPAVAENKVSAPQEPASPVSPIILEETATTRDAADTLNPAGGNTLPDADVSTVSQDVKKASVASPDPVKQWVPGEVTGKNASPSAIASQEITHPVNILPDTPGKQTDPQVLETPAVNPPPVLDVSKAVMDLPASKKEVLSEPALKKNVEPESDKKIKKVSEKAKKGPKKPKRKKSRWEQDMGFQAGPALAFQQLRKRDGTTVPAGHLEGRKATESSQESFTVGLFYSAALKKGLVLKTGLEYRQANEKFHLAYYNKEIEIINGVLTRTEDADGNIIDQTTGPKTITKTTEYTNTAFNQYRFVNWPIGAGYRSAGQKSSWELSGGVDINLLFRANATIYNSYNIPTVLKPGTSTYDDIFRRYTGMGLWGTYVYSWDITHKLRWQLSANAQIPFRPVSASDYGLVQRYFNFGVQVGMAYRFTVYD